MESKEITVAGLWIFAIVALIGGIYGKLDGGVLLVFFVAAVGVSLGIVAMPNSGHGGPDEGRGA
jgi:Ca2+/H+ antiporter